MVDCVDALGLEGYRIQLTDFSFGLHDALPHHLELSFWSQLRRQTLVCGDLGVMFEFGGGRLIVQ
jgi:hypothetical protein